MKGRDVSPEEAMKQIQKIFKKRGAKALDMARKEMLQEKIECKEAKEALTYFITQYWHDFARPSLLSLACEAVGGDPEQMTPIAIPLILISGAIDIHDDIIDQSKRKDGRPTVYGRYGKDMALLVGDALLFKGLTLLNKAAAKDIPTKIMRIVMDIVKDMFFELGDAEASELMLRGRIDVSPNEYLQIVRKKAADVEAHTRISALVGGGSRIEMEALGKYGRLLGMLIILRDDWIDLTDFEEAKQRIKRECLPLPTLYALQNPNVKRRVNQVLKKGRITTKDAQKVLALTQEGGGIKRFEMTVKELNGNALKQLIKMEGKAKYLRLLLKAAIPPVETAESSTTTTF